MVKQISFPLLVTSALMLRCACPLRLMAPLSTLFKSSPLLSCSDTRRSIVAFLKKSSYH